MMRATRTVSIALTALALVALAGCSSAPDGYITPFGPGKPTPLPTTPGRGLWNPPAINNTMASATSTVGLYSYLPAPDPQSRPEWPSYTPELPVAAERARQERALVALRDSEKARMERRLETDR